MLFAFKFHFLIICLCYIHHTIFEDATQYYNTNQTWNFCKFIHNYKISSNNIIFNFFIISININTTRSNISSSLLIYNLESNRRSLSIIRMDVENQFPQLIIKAPSSDIGLQHLSSFPVAHVVPASLKYNAEDAQVENYFQTTIKPYQSDDRYQEASLLGHELVGKIQNTNNLYDVVMEKQNNQVKLTLIRKINKVIDWRKDRPWAENDGNIKTVQKCIAIQHALHGL